MKKTGVTFLDVAAFAKTHVCDPDWIAAMEGKAVRVLYPGQQGTYAGYPATVQEHFRNGMYNVRVPGGGICISGTDFVPNDDSALANPNAGSIRNVIHVQFRRPPPSSPAVGTEERKLLDKILARAHKLAW